MFFPCLKFRNELTEGLFFGTFDGIFWRRFVCKSFRWFVLTALLMGPCFLSVSVVQQLVEVRQRLLLIAASFAYRETYAGVCFTRSSCKAIPLLCLLTRNNKKININYNFSRHVLKWMFTVKNSHQIVRILMFCLLEPLVIHFIFYFSICICSFMKWHSPEVFIPIKMLSVRDFLFENL